MSRKTGKASGIGVDDCKGGLCNALPTGRCGAATLTGTKRVCVGIGVNFADAGTSTAGSAK
ncbi:hypothetical protein [Rosistilla carotiformis]|uniref:hypothetical protein n=1 Tax=Rosistilla carotiformis TaxID=2528017 RepID=UPI0011A2403E|nr:hypothetical protein [Rosistilla carotiformis]